MAVLTREYFTKGFYPSGKANSADGFIPSSALVKASIIHSGQVCAFDGCLYVYVCA